MSDLLESEVFLVFAIFAARVIDVSLGTVRTIILFRGHKYLAALIGFVEVLIWIVAASHVVQNLDTWYLAVAYAGGFAVGNIVGISLEGRLAMGTQLVRAVSSNRSVELARELRARDYDVVELAGIENEAPVEVLLVVERRKAVPDLLKIIETTDPTAYCSISDVKDAAHGVGRARRSRAAVASSPLRK